MMLLLMVFIFILAGSIMDILRPAITSACRRFVSCSYVKLLSVNSAALALLAMAGYTDLRSLGLILSTVPMTDSRADGNDSDRRGRVGGSGAADAAATAATTPGPERRFSSCSVAAARPIRNVNVIFTVVVFVFISGGGGAVVVDVRRSHGRLNGSRP